MKKILYIVLLVIIGITMYSCENYETYADQRDYERSKIASFISNPTMGEIKGKPIKVISEEEFLQNDTVTDTTKNEFVLFDNTGVYMQIVRRGCGSILKKGESTTVLSRFNEYNINGDSLQLTNMKYDYQFMYEKFDVRNVSGTFYASFSQSEDASHYQSVMYLWYSSASVPGGWLVPLSYIKLGRPSKEGEEVAKVRLIVPHDQGHAKASSNVYACYYELTYERGI